MKSDEEIETLWRSIVIDHPWPTVDRSQLIRMMADASGGKPLSTALSDAWFRIASYWDVERHHELANRFDARMCRLTEAQRKRRVRLSVRCPDGCTLIEIYMEVRAASPTTDGGEFVYFYAKTERRVRAYYANGGTAADHYDPDVWAPIGCRHGSGRMGVGIPLDLAFCDLPKGSSRPITGSVPMSGEEVMIRDMFTRWVAKA